MLPLVHLPVSLFDRLLIYDILCIFADTLISSPLFDSGFMLCLQKQDSYYEYFIKSLLVTQGTEPEWSHYWWQVVDTVLDILVVNVPGFGLVLTDTNRHFVQSELRKTVGSGRIKMDHFSCFLP